MKILLSSIYHISSPNGGGNEQYLHHLALNLINLGHQVFYLTSQAKNISQYPYKIIVKPLPHFIGKPLISVSWIKTIKNLDFDIFHASGSGFALAYCANYIKYQLKKTTVLTFQAKTNPQNIIFRIAGIFEDYLISKNFSKIICTTPFYQTYLQKKWPNKKIYFIPMMLASHIKWEGKDKSKLKKQLNWDIHKRQILFVGKLNNHQYYKGVDILIKSVIYLDDSFQIMIIGEGNRKSTYQKLARSLGISSKIKFLELVTNDKISHYFNACDLFVLPSTSDSEGFGLVLIEAMACKVPTLTTDVIGSAGWFKKQKVTNFCKANDSKSLASEIIKLCNQNNHQLINRAYKFSQEFDSIKMAQKTLKAYE